MYFSFTPRCYFETRVYNSYRLFFYTSYLEGEAMQNLKHVLRAQQFDRQFIEFLFRRTDRMKSKCFLNREEKTALAQKCADRSLCALFYEPSTRTRISFQMAAMLLGMKVVVTENARDFSSAVKGETLEDTIRVICGYHFDFIVLRHEEDGASERAAKIADEFGVSIINAGDGKGQHPTQALLDLYTIQNELGSIDGKTVLIGGDLESGRTARSLTYLLSKFSDIRIIFISPPQLAMRRDILDHLEEKNVRYEVLDSALMLPQASAIADVIYWTRFQKERHADDPSMAELAKDYIISHDLLSGVKEEMIIMHPLPRVGEIEESVDKDPRAAYFRQAQKGLYVRMALLDYLCHPVS